MKPKIYVIYTDKWKLKVFDFSTIELAKDFIKTLDTKEYVILIGNEVTRGFQSM